MAIKICLRWNKFISKQNVSQKKLLRVSVTNGNHFNTFEDLGLKISHVIGQKTTNIPDIF